MKRAAIYARVSTDEQAKGYSLKTQIEACEKFAASKGYQVVEVFSEDYSGAMMDRPELDHLRERVSEGGIEIVIVYDIDRLARKAAYQMLIEEEFEKIEIRVEYVVGGYEDSDEGKLQKQIRALIAEYEKAKIIERMKRGKRGKAKSGYVIVGARPPYGCRRISEPHKAWLEIVEDEAKVVKQIYDWYLRGDGNSTHFSMNEIALQLTSFWCETRRVAAFACCFSVPSQLILI
jgi:site-specific DNA recombinase